MTRLLLVAGFLAIFAGLWRLPQIPRLPLPPQPLTQQVDLIRIDKSERAMTVYADGRALKTYRVALGRVPEGAKQVKGDGKTPEGVFKINRRNPRSKYHLSLGLDYPQASHRAAARAQGRSAGGDIFIHGQPNALGAGKMLGGDWTAGCIAVSNTDIQELWAHVPMGTEVRISP